VVPLLCAVVLAASPWAVAWAATPAATPTPMPGNDRIVTGPGNVLLIQAGKLTPLRAANPPPEADLRSLTVTKTDSGYEAHLTFAGPFHQLHDLNGTPAEHIVAATVRPPPGVGGQITRAALEPDGTGSLAHPVNNSFQTFASITPSIVGNQVILPFPVSAGATPDWEIDAVVAVLDAQNNGFHSHTAQVPLAALTGEVNPRFVPQSGDAALLVNGQVTPWQRGTPPAGTRPTLFHLERRAGKLVAVVTMDGVPQKLASLQGKPIAAQEVTLFVGPAADRINSGYQLDWDAQTGMGTVYDATRTGASPTAVGAFKVTTDGADLVFELPVAGGGATLHDVELLSTRRASDVPPDTNPIPGAAAGQKDPSSCPTAAPAVTFPVGVGIKSGNLEIVHQDNDVAAGPLQPNGTAHLTSPGGRTYDLISAQGTMLTLNHTYQGCTYHVTITLQSPLPPLAATSTLPTPTPGATTPRGSPPPLGKFTVPFTGESWIGVKSYVADKNLNGFAMDGTAVRVGPLLPPTGIRLTTASGPPWPLIIGGVVALVLIVAVVGVVLVRRRCEDDCDCDCCDCCDYCGDRKGGHLDLSTYPEWTPHHDLTLHPERTSYPEFTEGGEKPAPADPSFAYDRTHAVVDGEPKVPHVAPKEEGTGTTAATTARDEETTTTADDCDELRRRCQEALAAAEAAAAKAAAAAAAAATARRACDDAARAIAAAEAALRAAEADKPDDNSWVEDVKTGRRITVGDVRLENAAAQDAWNAYRSGDITAQELVDRLNQMDSPEGLDALRRAAREARQRRIDQARQDLERARAQRDTVCAAAADAARAASTASAAAAAARAAAEAICKLADECDKQRTPRPSETPTGGGSTPTGGGGGTSTGGTGGGVSSGGGTGAGGGHPEPKKEPKCQEGTEREQQELSGVLEIPAEGAEVQVVVTDLRGSTSTPHRYAPDRFYETTPPDFRGGAAGSGAIGAINLYTVDITIPMVSVEYGCVRTWVCRNGDWSYRGATRKQVRDVPYVKVLVHRENLDWTGVQAAIRSSWPGLKQILDAARQAQDFCPGAESQ
jgi:hypothetical protein